MKETNLIKQ